MGDFQHRVLQQQTPFQSVSQPDPPSPDFSPYPNERISQPIDTRNDQGTLSQETNILKIRELKRLMYKHHSNPDAFVKCATFYSSNGDNTLLDEWLERFRTIDAISK
jgi:hypothetical protein